MQIKLQVISVPHIDVRHRDVRHTSVCRSVTYARQGVKLRAQSSNVVRTLRHRQTEVCRTLEQIASLAVVTLLCVLFAQTASVSAQQPSQQQPAPSASPARDQNAGTAEFSAAADIMDSETEVASRQQEAASCAVARRGMREL